MAMDKELLEILEIPYTGPGALACERAMDKVVAIDGHNLANVGSLGRDFSTATAMSAARVIPRPTPAATPLTAARTGRGRWMILCNTWCHHIASVSKWERICSGF